MTVAQQFDYWLLTDRNLDQYISLTQEAARAYEQMQPVMQQAVRDWAQISAVAQEHVEQIARFRAQREKRNNRTTTLLTDLAGARCPLGDCSGELTGRDTEEDERFAEIVGRGLEIRCTACGAEVFPPPAMWLRRQGAEYFRAGRELLRSADPQSVSMPATFVLHQAAELYLKSLGTIDVYREDADDETPVGPGLEHKKHDLDQLLSKVYPSIRSRLEQHINESSTPTQTVRLLVDQIPGQTAEYCRYGYLFKGQYPEVCISPSGMAICTEDGTETNATQALMELCTFLDGFARAESPW